MRFEATAKKQKKHEYPAACGKSRHRASPALWVAIFRMMIVMTMMVMVMMMTIAMETTAMTMRRGRRRRRKRMAVTCGAFLFTLLGI